MKNEQKRYFLTCYHGTREKIVSNYSEVLQIIESIKSYNNSKKSKYIFGNVSLNKVGECYVIKSHVYDKLSEKMTISDILSLTLSMDKKEIIEKYKDKIGTKEEFHPDINVSYFESSNDSKNIGVRYLPLMTREDAEYLTFNYFDDSLRFLAGNDLKFFDVLIDKVKYDKGLNHEVDNLKHSINLMECKMVTSHMVYASACVLLNKYLWDKKRGSYNQRRVYDIGILLKYYGNYDKIPSPVKHNKDTNFETKKYVFNK